MKRILPYLLALTLIVVIFSGCKPLFPIDNEDFELGDTITLRVGKKLYQSDSLWVSLDTISHDDRNIATSSTIRGGIHGKITVGGWGDSQTYMFESDSAPYFHFYVPFEYNFGGYYIVSIVDVQPVRFSQTEVIPQQNYRVKLVLNADFSVDKPNIYIYPTKKTRMTVSLDLPEGGKVTESIPEYPKKWKNIRVKPDGTINRKYDFLFYEADLPGNWQKDEGWCVAQKELKFFFLTNMRDYGFSKKEINDFLEWWIPRLKDKPYYKIYPQHTAKINEIVPLKINKKVDSLLRLFYFIEGSDYNWHMKEPVVPPFKRNGFVVTEWGVSVIGNQ